MPYLIILFFTTFARPAFSAHLNKEKYYQDKWFQKIGGQTEVLLPDNTRCDCLTDQYAIEFDFADKWQEAIGQSLYYALQTNKEASIGLIIATYRDYKYWLRLNSTILHHKLPIIT